MQQNLNHSVIRRLSTIVCLRPTKPKLTYTTLTFQNSSRQYSSSTENISVLMQKSANDCKKADQTSATSIIQHNILLSSVDDCNSLISSIQPTSSVKQHPLINVSKLSNFQSVSYCFTKNGSIKTQTMLQSSIIQKQRIAYDLLKISFLNLGCLISRPTFKLVSAINDSKRLHNPKNDSMMKTQPLAYTEDPLLAIENSQDLIKGKQKWIVRLFFYIRNPLLRSKTYKGKIITSNLRKSKMLALDRTLTVLSKAKSNEVVKINFLDKYRSTLTYIVKELSNILHTTDIELEIIQLKKSYHNSNILAQHLNLRSYKYRFVKLINKFLKKFSYIQQPSGQTRVDAQKVSMQTLSAVSTSKISGVKIRLGGRTFKQKIIPRRTVQQIQRGSLARGNEVKLVEKSRVIGKTRRGAYSFTVTLGHVICRFPTKTKKDA